MKILKLHIRGAFGSFAVGDNETYRPTQEYPTRSAVIGLLGAAKGVMREDQRQWYKTTSDLAIYAKKNQTGNYGTIWDLSTVSFHPLKGIDEQSGRPIYATHQRADGQGTATNPLRNKQYLVSPDFYVYIRADSQQDEQLLSLLSDCLRRPFFPLYIGRKHCPLNCDINEGFVDGLPDGVKYIER